MTKPFFQRSNWNDEYGQERLTNPWISTPFDYFAETVSPVASGIHHKKFLDFELNADSDWLWIEGR